MPPPKTGLLQARRAAVQALYAMEVAQQDMAAGLALFAPERPGRLVSRAAGAKVQASFAHFEQIVRGAHQEKEKIDALLERHLRPGWRLARLDRVMLALLRAGAGEILLSPDAVQGEGRVADYARLAHDFLAPEPAGVAHAILDKLSDAYDGGV